MTSRRGDRRYEDDDRGDRRIRKDAERRTVRDDPPPREAKKAKGTSDLNNYFIKGDGIHREVLQKEICRFLGPEATSKPEEYKGVNGYMIRAVRPFTAEMLDDLIDLSKGYVSERKEKERRGQRDIRYDQSDISRGREISNRRVGQDVEMDEEEDDYEDDYRPQPSRGPRDDRTRYPPDRETRGYGSQFPPGSYTSGPGPTPLYASTSEYPVTAPRTGYPPSGYLMEAPIQQQGSPYPPSYTTGIRPEGNYVYGGPEYPSQNDPYGGRPPASYTAPGPREPLREDYRDNPRHTPGTRIETRDNRPPPRYYPGSPPGVGDVAMGGMDDGAYRYPPSSTSQTSRGPYGSSSSRAAPSPYDPNPADLRDPYRPPPSREERRPRR